MLPGSKHNTQARDQDAKINPLCSDTGTMSEYTYTYVYVYDGVYGCIHKSIEIDLHIYRERERERQREREREK